VEIELEKFQEAVKVANKAMVQNPQRAGAALARPFYDQGYYDLAGLMAQSAANGGVENGFISFVLGRVASINGDVETSIQHLEKAEQALSDGPTNDIQIATLVFLAEGYMAQKKPEQGISTLQKALKLNPTLGQTRAVLAEALYSLDRKDQARKILDEGLERKPGDPPIMEALIGMAMGNGEKDQAWSLAQEFFSKQRHQAVDPLCQIFLTTGAPDLAEKAARLILKTMPNAGQPYVVLGRIAHQSKDFKQAAIHFEKALELLEEDETQGPWLEQALFHLGDGAALQGNPQAASQYFKRAMALNPASPNIRVALSVLYAQVGQAEVAVNIMDNWLKYYPTPLNVKIAVDTLQKLGLTDAADRLKAGR